MLPKDLLDDLETGDRTMEMLKDVPSDPLQGQSNLINQLMQAAMPQFGSQRAFNQSSQMAQFGNYLGAQQGRSNW